MSRVFSLIVALAGCGACDEEKPKGDAAVARCLAARAPLTGEATYYTADGTGNCSFAADATRMVAALNGPDYGTAVWCGACVEVTGPSGTVVVRIVDKCPGCAPGDLDLSREAFERISPLSAGRVPITWREVACDVTGPISYQFKDGSSQFWTGIQLRNHRYPIATLEARDAGGAYRSIARLDYNYFVDSDGLGPGPYTLRVTDTRGQGIEDTNIAVGDNVARTGASQFPACPN
ncbi:MAG: expansin EXLX1 family cellulose-binding protein [Kofleriaceae bacterium]